MLLNKLFLIIFLIISPLKVHAADCTPFTDAEFSPTTLINFVRLSKYLKVEDVLCKLPTAFRSQYSIEFFSEVGAAQGATVENPRVHFFNNEMVLTFNGDSGQMAGDDIEIGYVNKNSPLGDATIVDFLLPGNYPQVRDPVTLGCMACHGSTERDKTGARLLFNAAPFWEGFYGTSGFASDDSLGEYYTQEKANFEEFRRKALIHPRYKYLVDLDKKVLSSDEFTKKYGDTNVDPNLYDRTILGRVNLTYSIILANLNHNRVLKLIMNSPHYNEFKFAIFASISGECTHEAENVNSFLPKEVQALYTNESSLYPVLHGPVTPKMIDDIKLQVQIDGMLEGDPFGTGQKMMIAKPRSLEEANNVVASLEKTHSLVSKFYVDSDIRQEFYGANVGYGELRYLFEGRTPPVSMREWSIDPKKGYYRFNNAKGVDDDEIRLVPMLRQADPELASISVLKDFDRVAKECNPSEACFKEQAVPPQAHAEGCAILKDKSLKRLGDPKVIAALIRESKISYRERGFEVIQRECKTCHTLGVMHAPILPFTDEKEFQKAALEYDGSFGKAICERIQRKEHQRGVMPKYGPLSDADKQNILSYLSDIGVGSPCSKSR